LDFDAYFARIAGRKCPYPG